MRRNGSRCCCRRSGALPPVCRLPFSEKIPQGPSVADPKNNPALFRRCGGGQFRVPPRRPRRQEKETRFEGNFLPLLWLLPLLLPFYDRRAARATSASAGRRRCCCCCTFSDELHFFLCSFAPSSLPFLVFFHSAFQRNLLFFLSRSNPAEIETQISRTRTHPGGTENSGLEAHSLGPPELTVTALVVAQEGRNQSTSTFLSHYVTRHSSSSSIIFLSLSL